MRPVFVITMLFMLLTGEACKKDNSGPTDPGVSRTVQFVLYTDKDFSNNDKNIVFRLSIQRANSDVLWDSVLATMKIKDIPGQENKIIVEKSVLAPANALLKTGFYYTIETVGNSWHLDSIAPGVTNKTIEFNFQ